MLSDLTKKQPTLQLSEVDIPDPWDEVTTTVDETSIISKEACYAIDMISSKPALPSEPSLHQLAAAPIPNPVALLIQDELKLNRQVDSPLFIKIQDLLAQLYLADSICDRSIL